MKVLPIMIVHDIIKDLPSVFELVYIDFKLSIGLY